MKYKETDNKFELNIFVYLYNWIQYDYWVYESARARVLYVYCARKWNNRKEEEEEEAKTFKKKERKIIMKQPVEEKKM